jgi:hypothetical protein
MFRFTIRDVLWLTALVAVLAAWWLDIHRKSIDRQELAVDRNLWEARARNAYSLLRSEAYSIEWIDSAPYMKVRYPSAEERSETAVKGVIR